MADEPPSPSRPATRAATLATNPTPTTATDPDKKKENNNYLKLFQNGSDSKKLEKYGKRGRAEDAIIIDSDSESEGASDSDMEDFQDTVNALAIRQNIIDHLSLRNNHKGAAAGGSLIDKNIVNNTGKNDLRHYFMKMLNTQGADDRSRAAMNLNVSKTFAAAADFRALQSLMSRSQAQAVEKQQYHPVFAKKKPKQSTVVHTDTNVISKELIQSMAAYGTSIMACPPSSTTVPCNSTPTPTPAPATVLPTLPVQQPTPTPPAPPILESLTDDMTVLEAPSFVVPYVYEKPPIASLTDCLLELKKTLSSALKDDDGTDKPEKVADSETNEDSAEEILPETKPAAQTDNGVKNKNYFENPLGKFFIDIGFDLVQERVQADLLRQHKGKLKKEKKQGGRGIAALQSGVAALTANLAASKERNAPFRLRNKVCQFCDFSTESDLVMEQHLESPHYRGGLFRCNRCPFDCRGAQEIVQHCVREHGWLARLPQGPVPPQTHCPTCHYHSRNKKSLEKHLLTCSARFIPENNQKPDGDWEPPAKIVKKKHSRVIHPGMYTKNDGYFPPVSNGDQMGWLLQAVAGQATKSVLPVRPLRAANGLTGPVVVPKSFPADWPATPRPKLTKLEPKLQPQIDTTKSSKSEFVICEVCDGYIRDKEQLRQHLQVVHALRLHPKLLRARAPLNCQKCHHRFYTDQGLERHLLGSHGLVSRGLQDAATAGKDAGRCPTCGKVFNNGLLSHVSESHGLRLRPAQLSYKCTLCQDTFPAYSLFEKHVYTQHAATLPKTNTHPS